MNRRDSAERRTDKEKDELAMQRGRVVKRLRERRNWTMAELARRSGVSESYVSRFESGNIPNAAAQAVADLATALEVSVDYLMSHEAQRQAAQANPNSNTVSIEVEDPDLRVYLSNLGRLPEHDQRIIKSVMKQMMEEENRQRPERGR